MFRKSILQLQLKDKLFFILVAILAIVGIFFGAREGASYLSGPIKGHKEQLSDNKTQVTQLEAEYGPHIKDTLAELKKIVKQLQQGLFAEINNLGWRKVAGILTVILCVKEIIINVFSRVFLSSA